MAKSSFLQRRYLVPQKLIPLGSWKGVRDVGDSGAQDPAYLQDAINAHFADPKNGGAVYARPRFSRHIDESILSMGSVSFVQALFSAEVSGTFYEFAIVNGTIYRNSTGTTWVDVSPLSGGTINSGAGRVHVVPFINSSGAVAIIVNDEANEPWVGTGLTASNLTATEIEINTAGSAWIARGAPTVHGGKVFFIVDDIASTKHDVRVVWSEELDPATGYMQTGYTNFWDMVQTGTDRIHQILGTNAGLYVFRRNSTALVRGSVNADFQAASTHADVSPTTGSVHPVLFANEYIWFYDAEGLPHRFTLGGSTLDPIWEQMRHRIGRIRQTIATSTGFCIDYPKMAYSDDMKKVAMLFLRDADGDTQETAAARNIYMFDAANGSYEGRWTVEQAEQSADETPGAAVIRHIASTYTTTAFSSRPGLSAFLLGGTVDGTGENGWIWRQALQQEFLFGDNSAAMHFSITPMLNPNDQVTEFRVDEIAVDALPDSGTMSIDYYTPRASSVGQLTMTGITGTDSIQSSHDHGRYVAGLNALGRWFRPVLHWNVAAGSTQYAFERAILKVRGFPASPRAK